MTTIALFRGINVGGKNKVAMAALREMLEELGLSQVRTYIQSGNALFETEMDEAQLAASIESGFRNAFGFDSPVIIRSADGLDAIIENIPFSESEIEAAKAAAHPAECLYCYLLAEAAPQYKIEALDDAYAGSDRLVANGREIYLLCYRSIRDSRLAASLSKLKIPMTARNFKTLRKLCEMANC